MIDIAYNIPKHYDFGKCKKLIALDEKNDENDNMSRPNYRFYFASRNFPYF
jgi:hypothetical protein